MKMQYCCIAGGVSLPCNAEYAPMACTLLPFCAVYPKFGCCKNLEDIAPEAYPDKENDTGVNVTVNVTGAAPALEMCR